MSDYKFTEAQEAWLQKLESDEMQDKQGKSRLIDGDGKMCCLGVFCSMQPDVTRVCQGFMSPNQNFMTHALTDVVLIERLGVRFPHAMLREAVKVKSTSVGGLVSCGSLAKLNDEGWTFKQIAAYIRANPENVFGDENDI